MRHGTSSKLTACMLTLACSGPPTALGSEHEALLIGGPVCNGDLNAPGGTDSTYAQTPYLTNIGTSDAYQVCIKIDETCDGGPNALISEAAGRITAFDPGHVIQPDDVFGVSYWWKDSFSWNDALDNPHFPFLIGAPSGILSEGEKANS